MEMSTQERAMEVRAWLAKNVNTETLAFPSEDQTWEFITTTWPEISPNKAESILGEAMKPIAIGERELSGGPGCR